MSSPAKVTNIQKACQDIDATVVLANTLTPIVPSNFATLKDAVIQKYLHREAQNLSILFHSDSDLKEIKKTFKQLLLKHFEVTEHTALSMAAMPESPLNSLYFQLVHLLFSPANLKEFCDLLEIKPRTHLELEHKPLPRTSDRSVKRQAMKNIEMEFKSYDFATWAATQPCPQTVSDFASLLFTSEAALSLSDDVLTLPFKGQRVLHQVLRENHPILHQAIYQRNEFFKQLASDIDMYEKNGRTAYEALSSFIRGLELGGERMTGQTFAAIVSIEAAGLFNHYLDSIPKDHSEKIKALSSTSDKTIADVLNDLAKKECVETAASDLKKILGNSENAKILDARPHLNRDDLQQIEDKYKDLDIETVCLWDESHLYLPTELCENLISSITVRDAYELIPLLIDFPESLYEIILRNLNFSAMDNPLEVLVKHLEKGFFNEAQALSLIKVMAMSYENFQNEKRLIHYLLNKPRLLLTYLESLPDDKVRLKIVNEKDNNNNTVLHCAATNVDSLEVLLALYQDDNARLKAVNEKNKDGYTVFHCAATIPESLEKLLALYKDDDERLNAVNEKNNRHGKTVFHYAVSSPESLEKLLALYKDDDERLKAVNEKNKDGKTVFHCAVSSPESLEKLLSLYKDDDARLKAVNEKNRHGKTALYSSASYPKSLEKLLALFKDDKARLKAVTQNSEYGYTPLQIITKETESIEKLLISFETDEIRLQAVNEKDRNGNTILKVMSETPEELKKLLESFETDEARLKALNEKIILGKTLLHFAIQTPEKNKILFASFHESFQIKLVINALRKKEISFNFLPDHLKINKEVIIAAHYPCLDFIFQNPAITSASLGLFVAAGLETMGQSLTQSQILSVSTTAALTVYKSMHFFTPNLRQPTSRIEEQRFPGLRA
jgi:ankyrin repeat protein